VLRLRRGLGLRVTVERGWEQASSPHRLLAVRERAQQPQLQPIQADSMRWDRYAANARQETQPHQPMAAEWAYHRLFYSSWSHATRRREMSRVQTRQTSWQPDCRPSKPEMAVRASTVACVTQKRARSRESRRIK
jgi:hypothetical protein